MSLLQCGKHHRQVKRDCTQVTMAENPTADKDVDARVGFDRKCFRACPFRL